MKLLDLTLASPAENLALDEALLDAAEEGELDHEVLRLWEPAAAFVVVGRSGRLAEEVHMEACREAGVPVLRRSSGGGTVLLGPGCLVYSCLLTASEPRRRMINQVHEEVLEKVAAGLAVAGEIRHRGTSDLIVGSDRKCSGNSLRIRRKHLLYHGTVLYDFPLHSIECYLKMPPRQPDYRQSRPHGDFVSNLQVSCGEIRQGLTQSFAATQSLESWPQERTQQLVATKYGRGEWNESR